MNEAKKKLRDALDKEMDIILSTEDVEERRKAIENAAKIRNLMTSDRDAFIGHAMEGCKVAKDVVLGIAGLAAWLHITYGGYRMEYIDDRVPTSTILKANMTKPAFGKF